MFLHSKLQTYQFFCISCILYFSLFSLFFKKKKRIIPFVLNFISGIIINNYLIKIYINYTYLYSIMNYHNLSNHVYDINIYKETLRINFRLNKSPTLEMLK